MTLHAKPPRLIRISGCRRYRLIVGERGVKVTVYGLNPWNSMLTFGVEAGPVPRADLQGLCEIITERLKRLYVIDART